MAFGEPITVERLRSVPGQADIVVLRSFTVADVASCLPLETDDPAFDYLHPMAHKWFTGPGVYSLPRSYASWNELLGWGVFAQNGGGGQEEMRGIAALTSGEGRVGANYEILLAAGARGQGYGKLALAGLIRAFFTPGLLHAQNAHFPAGSARPVYLKAEIHPSNEPSKQLAHRMGFNFARATINPEDDFRQDEYLLYGSLFTDPEAGAVWGEGTARAHEELSNYRVQSAGSVPIPHAPDDMLRPFPGR